MILYLFGQKYEEKFPQKTFLLTLDHAAEKRFPDLRHSQLLVTDSGNDLWKFTFYHGLDIFVDFDSVRMKVQEPRSPRTDRFVDWPISAVETFVKHISGKNNGNHEMDSEKVYALLLILTSLKWEKKREDIPLLPPKELDIISETYMRPNISQQLLNDYEKVFSGIKLKDLAAYCLATGSFPQNRDLLRRNDLER